jgi:hypothetical protein
MENNQLDKPNLINAALKLIKKFDSQLPIICFEDELIHPTKVIEELINLSDKNYQKIKALESQLKDLRIDYVQSINNKTLKDVVEILDKHIITYSNSSYYVHAFKEFQQLLKDLFTTEAMAA